MGQYFHLDWEHKMMKVSPAILMACYTVICTSAIYTYMNQTTTTFTYVHSSKTIQASYKLSCDPEIHILHKPAITSLTLITNHDSTDAWQPHILQSSRRHRFTQVYDTDAGLGVLLSDTLLESPLLDEPLILLFVDWSPVAKRLVHWRATRSCSCRFCR